MAKDFDRALEILEDIKQSIAKIAQDRIDPRRLLISEGLSDIDLGLGLVKAGEFRTGNAEDPGHGFSGVRIAYPAMAYDGEEWHVVGCDNDVLQFGLRASDGAALFGGGVAVIDSEGLKIVDASSKPVFTVLTAATTINSESLGLGDILIGDNSSGKPNLLWDNSEGQLLSREGTVAAGEVGGGTFQQYGVSVLGKGSGTTNDIVSGTNTTISFDHATEQVRYDDADFFDTGNPDRITIPAGFGGRYLIGVGGDWETTFSGGASIWISIDGVEPFSPSTQLNASTGGFVGVKHESVHERELDAGEVIRLRVKQNSGSNKEFRFAFMWLHKVR